MKRLCFAVVLLVLSMGPARADSSYRVDRLFGASASFSTGSTADNDYIWASVEFVGEEIVQGAGEESARSSSVGLCVSIASDYEALGAAYRATRSERGCVDVRPAEAGPTSVSATIPTTIWLYGAPLEAPVAIAESSVTLSLSWSSGGSSSCNLGGGYAGGSGLPPRVETEQWTERSPAIVTGSISSAVHGDVSEPTPQACLVEGTFIAATADAPA